MHVLWRFIMTSVRELHSNMEGNAVYVFGTSTCSWKNTKPDRGNENVRSH